MVDPRRMEGARRIVVLLGNTLDVHPVGSNRIAVSRRSNTLHCCLWQCIDHCIGDRSAADVDIDRWDNNS